MCRFPSGLTTENYVVFVFCSFLSLLTDYTSGVVLQKLTVARLVKKIPVFCGIRKFITVFTRSRHWTLS